MMNEGAIADSLLAFLARRSRDAARLATSQPFNPYRLRYAAWVLAIATQILTPEPRERYQVQTAWCYGLKANPQ
uniref:hypothetical protein n=1 Tax=Trichocoleus desertorum TaxID=1481672 RepID=UPI0025B60103|nr:hypothetical protein [Trichocoleus desertorum]